VRICELWVGWGTRESGEEALRLHGKGGVGGESGEGLGIAAVKFASAAVGTARAAGIDGVEGKLVPRRPYEPLGGKAKEGIRSVMAEMVEIEAGL
jgi:4-hydroxy-2-oxoglutarate aldolase